MRSEMCSLHLTHPSGAVGSRHCGARGAVGGSVPCSRVSPQSWTSRQSRDLNSQPWVTSGFKSNALSIRPRLPLHTTVWLLHTRDSLTVTHKHTTVWLLHTRGVSDCYTQTHYSVTVTHKHTTAWLLHTNNYSVTVTHTRQSYCYKQTTTVWLLHTHETVWLLQTNTLQSDCYTQTL